MSLFICYDDMLFFQLPLVALFTTIKLNESHMQRLLSSFAL